MKVLILGATGMLGQSLMNEARKRGINVAGASRNGPDIRVDITDDKALRDAVDSFCPEIIINSAAITNLSICENDPGLAYLVNAKPAGVLAEILRNSNAYLVQISTDHYFTGDRDIKHSEGSPVCLLNEYARTKYAGEEFTLTYSRGLVLRTNIVGFRYKKGLPTFLEWVVQSIENDLSMTLFEDFFTSSIHVKQFSAALFDLLDKFPTGVINFASREVFNKKVFIESVATRLGYKLSNTQAGSVLELKDVCRAESLGLDVTKAENMLGYKLSTFDEVIESVISEYRGSCNAVG